MPDVFTADALTSLLQVIMIDLVLAGDNAIVIGKFFLTRTKAGGGDTTGIFTLVFRKTRQGWKIILDHTS